MIDRFNNEYKFLSNFYPCEIEYQGIEYPSVEHFYVAMKCNSDQIIDNIHYDKISFREKVSNVSTAGKVKALGKKIKIRENWDDIKLKVMSIGLNQKFNHDDLKALLISTNDEELVEGNYWHDNFYGQCTCEKCKGKGKNNLGKMLMRVRDELNGIKRGLPL